MFLKEEFIKTISFNELIDNEFFELSDNMTNYLT